MLPRFEFLFSSMLLSPHPTSHLTEFIRPPRSLSQLQPLWECPLWTSWHLESRAVALAYVSLWMIPGSTSVASEPPPSSLQVSIPLTVPWHWELGRGVGDILTDEPQGSMSAGRIYTPDREGPGQWSANCGLRATGGSCAVVCCSLTNKFVDHWPR